MIIYIYNQKINSEKIKYLNFINNSLTEKKKHKRKLLRQFTNAKFNK